MTPPDEPAVTDADYRDILAFRDQLRRFLHWSEGEAARVGLPPAQHQLLLAVRGHPADEDPAIGDIAGHLQLRHHSAVELVNRAESAGLVERVTDENDRRVVHVRLLEPGRRALDDLTVYHLAELRVLAETFASLRLPEPPGRPEATG